MAGSSICEAESRKYQLNKSELVAKKGRGEHCSSCQENMNLPEAILWAAKTGSGYNRHKNNVKTIIYILIASERNEIENLKTNQRGWEEDSLANGRAW